MPAGVFREQFQFIPHEEILRFEEITRLAEISIGLGARKLRITGGEPLVRPPLDRLIYQLAQLPDRACEGGAFRRRGIRTPGDQSSDEGYTTASQRLQRFFPPLFPIRKFPD